MLLYVLGQFVGLGFVAIEQMGNALWNAGYSLDRITRRLSNRLRVAPHAALEGLHNHINVGGIGNSIQRGHFAHADGECRSAVGRKIAEAADKNIVMHEPVGLNRFTDMKVGARRQLRSQTRCSGLLRRLFEIDGVRAASAHNCNHYEDL